MDKKNSIAGIHTLNRITDIYDKIDEIEKARSECPSDGEKINLKEYQTRLEQECEQCINEVREWVSYFPTCYNNYRKFIEEYYCSGVAREREFPAYVDSRGKALKVYTPVSNFRRKLKEIEIEMIKKGIYPPTSKYDLIQPVMKCSDDSDESALK